MDPGILQVTCLTGYKNRTKSHVTKTVCFTSGKFRVVNHAAPVSLELRSVIRSCLINYTFMVGQLHVHG